VSVAAYRLLRLRPLDASALLGGTTRELERAIADVNAASHQPAIFQQLEADIKQAGLFVAKLMTGLEKVRLDLPSPLTCDRGSACHAKNGESIA